MKKTLLAILAFPLVGFAQISITGTGSTSQDFNTLENTGTGFPWVDNTTIPNWYAQRSGTGTTYNANNGGANAGGLYSYGSIGETERSLGTIGSGTAGHFAIGVQLQNNAPTSVVDVSVSFTMEQWRNGGTTNVNTLSFYYKKSSSIITTLNPNANLSWTAVTALNTSNPIGTTTSSALNGNDPANKVVVSNISIPGLELLPGEYLMLKWDDPDNGGADHGLSIDDVTINYTVTCETFSTINATSCTDYTLNSTTYNVSGTYTQVLPNANIFGCDSTITLNLTMTTGITFYEDLDNDGYGNTSVTQIACSQPVGFATLSGDCNDSDNTINPGAPELCNGADENCDGNVDEGVTLTFYEDLDNDNYGNSAVFILACSAPVGYVSAGNDCDDANSSIHPGAIDIPFNGIDEDCNGSDATSSPMIGIYEFTGTGACPNISTSVTAQPTDAVFSAYSSSNTGCVETANVFNNDGWNTTPSIDLTEYNEFTITANDCKQMILSKLSFEHRNSGTGSATWTVRSSVDNFTNDLATGTSSSTLTNQDVLLGTEFSGLNSITFRFYVTSVATTGTTWRQDNVSVYGLFSTVTPQSYFADLDSDSYGDPNSSILACTPPAGYVSNNSDCDDSDFFINPLTVWYEDADGDLLGNSSVSFTGCTPPNSTYVLSGGDCDDSDATIGDPVGYYIDADNDGFGSANSTVSFLCADPGVGYSTNNLDCLDSDNTTYPNAPELCDGIDNDCNGQIDNGLVFIDYFLDADNDGFGDGAAINACESPGSNYVEVDGDCNDTDDTVYPGASEIIDDSIDQNCDGVDGYVGINEIDELIVTVAPNPTNGNVIVNFNEFVNASLVLTDLNGKNCFETTFEGQSKSIDLSSMTDGVYILKITSEVGFTQKRLVIQK